METNKEGKESLTASQSNKMRDDILDVLYSTNSDTSALYGLLHLFEGKLSEFASIKVAEKDKEIERLKESFKTYKGEQDQNRVSIAVAEAEEELEQKIKSDVNETIVNQANEIVALKKQMKDFKLLNNIFKDSPYLASLKEKVSEVAESRKDNGNEAQKVAIRVIQEVIENVKPTPRFATGGELVSTDKEWISVKERLPEID